MATVRPTESKSSVIPHIEPVLLHISDISCSFDGLKAVSNLSFDVASGELIALIGPNGAGKTTLFNMLCGFVRSNKGCIIFADEEITYSHPYIIACLGIGRTFQDCKIFRQLSVLENVMLGFRNKINETLLAALMRNSSVRNLEYAKLKYAELLLKEADLFDKRTIWACNLSYGQRKLLELCRIQAMDPKLYLLDEPLAGLHPATASKIMGIIRDLREAGKTIIFIEHDMNTVTQLAERVIVLNYGQVIADGATQSILNNPLVLDAYLGRYNERAT